MFIPCFLDELLCGCCFLFTSLFILLNNGRLVMKFLQTSFFPFQFLPFLLGLFPHLILKKGLRLRRRPHFFFMKGPET